MRKQVLIIDCYTVEPAGLGFPPYISTYARYAYGCFYKLGFEVRYATIDDFRHDENVASSHDLPEGHTNPYIYSLTCNSGKVFDLLREATWVVIIAGDTVPSKHIQAVSASFEELRKLISCARGRCILYGPLSFAAREKTHPLHDELISSHTHTITPDDYLQGSAQPVDYNRLQNQLGDFRELFAQIPWQVVAEIELYRGCTRARLCSFCFEPVKNDQVVFRDVNDVIKEITALYSAGVRRFRLGQQACFFSYQGKSPQLIERLLAGIREACPDIDMLHIDNVDPLAAASSAGRQIARLVCEYCTPGNCAPMGIESFDSKVISINNLTCTPKVLLRAMSNVEEYGSQRASNGLCMFLPGLNLIYGLAGESPKTHEENLRWLEKIYSEGHLAGRTNIRQAAVYQGTPLVSIMKEHPAASVEELESRKSDIANIYDMPMKKRVFPRDLTIKKQHAFYRDAQGTWFRAYGSYPIMTIVENENYPLFEEHDLVVTGHASRNIYGRVVA